MSEDLQVVETKRLGLAAFMKVSGCILISVKSRVFSFESEKRLLEWEIEYANSCCKKHDAEVCELRKLLTLK